MTVGLSFSGGGITGLLASTCVLNSLNSHFPDFAPSTDVAFSTTSGGTIGYGIWTNAGESMFFPRYDVNVTYDDASSQLTEDKEYVGVGVC